MTWILVLIAVALLAWAVFAFNRLVRLRNQWRTAWADIDVQLQRRHDLVPQLVASVKGYARHESALLEAVTALRSQALTLSGPKQLGEIEDALEQGLGRLLALREAYPDLKASANFMQLTPRSSARRPTSSAFASSAKRASSPSSATRPMRSARGEARARRWSPPAFARSSPRRRAGLASRSSPRTWRVSGLSPRRRPRTIARWW
jgi:hypothetical protein